MRAYRAVAGAVLCAVVLAGCGASGSGSGDDAPPTSPSRAPAPSGAASPTVGKPPSADQTLVRVTRTGGFAGQTHSLVVKDDGSWTRLDGGAKPEGTGKLSEAELAALRTALREADFAGLPRIATGGPTIYDGFSYEFVHGGFEVAGAEGSLAPALGKVLAALPRSPSSRRARPRGRDLPRLPVRARPVRGPVRGSGHGGRVVGRAGSTAPGAAARRHSPTVLTNPEGFLPLSAKLSAKPEPYLRNVDKAVAGRAVVAGHADSCAGSSPRPPGAGPAGGPAPGTSRPLPG